MTKKILLIALFALSIVLLLFSCLLPMTPNTPPPLYDEPPFGSKVIRTLLLFALIPAIGISFFSYRKHNIILHSITFSMWVGLAFAFGFYYELMDILYFKICISAGSITLLLAALKELKNKKGDAEN